MMDTIFLTQKQLDVFNSFIECIQKDLEPSINTVMKLTGYSKNSIYFTCTRLEQLGLFTKKLHGKKGNFYQPKTDIHILLFDRLGRIPQQTSHSFFWRNEYYKRRDAEEKTKNLLNSIWR